MTGADTRTRLLDAAWDLARARNLEEVTLADVGRQAGVSRQAVYLHFGNRTTLLVEMARHVDRRSGFLAKVAAARDLEPRPALFALLDSWFDYLGLILPLARSLEAAVVNGSDGAEAYVDRMADWREGIRLAVDRLDQARELAKGLDTERAADLVYTLVHPTTYHHLTGERGWTPEAAESTICSMIEREILAPKRGRR